MTLIFSPIEVLWPAYPQQSTQDKYNPAKNQETIRYAMPIANPAHGPGCTGAQ